MKILLYRLIILNVVQLDYWLLDDKYYLDVWKFIKWREDGLAE